MRPTSDDTCAAAIRMTERARINLSNLGVERPTVKARHSSKYFGRGKGVVAYTLLCNHIPLQGWLIGAHELEALGAEIVAVRGLDHLQARLSSLETRVQAARTEAETS